MTVKTKKYTKEQVMELINNYPFYISRIQELRSRYMNEVGGGNIAQYGVESVMPKAQGDPSDPIFNEFKRLQKMDKELVRLESKVRYLQNRWIRITDNRMKLVFDLRLSGKTYKKIAKETNLSHQRVHQIIREVSMLLID